jgi:pyruvate dehydrogenase E1 component alpha subunit
MGGSASLGDITHNIYPHDGMLGSQAPIAVGACMASSRRTYVHIADASAEEDYVLGALGMAATHQLPILFICEDNNLSILTEKKVRRSWNIVDVAESFGLDALDIDDTIDDIQLALNTIKLPGLINIECERHYWHAGSGQDSSPNIDRIKELHHYFNTTSVKINDLEKKIDTQIEAIWQPLLM